MKHNIVFVLCCILLASLSGCSVNHHLAKDQYVLRKTNIKLKSNLGVSDKGILNDNLQILELQKPNTYLFNLFPYKVWLYNLSYKKYQKDTNNFQLRNKVVEKPVIFDSTLMRTSSLHMQSYLKNIGYFYAKVDEKVKLSNQKAFVTYNVNTGINYVIDSVNYNVQDKEIAKIIPQLKKESLFTKATAYSNILASEERNHIVKEIHSLGYYKFSVDNISFVLDTVTNRTFTITESPFLSAVNFLLEGLKSNKRPRLNIEVDIHSSKDSLAFDKYFFNKVVVITDYSDTLKVDSINYHVEESNGIEFRYHKRTVNVGILERKIFIRPGQPFSQKDYNQTLKQLNNLDVFEYVRIYITEDTEDSTRHLLNCYIVAAPSKKYNFQTNVEVSGGDLYVIGTSANLSVTDNNFLKGANKLTTTVSYGLELGQNKTEPLPFLKQFYLFSKNVGLNFRLSFPKFLLPINRQKFSRSALPTTFIETGISSLKRINYFSLRSFNGSFGYLWKESPIKTWTVKPVFTNILHLSNVDPNFQDRMDSIEAIGNSYQEAFIEGEEIEYTLNSAGRNKSKYLYLKLGLQEAGALLGAVKGISRLFPLPLNFSNAHYFRFDFDLKQYLLRRNSSTIFRFTGGVGVPYGKSTVLPYIKQYFVGGAYSIRGWRPRVLGPGSYNAIDKNPDNYLFIDQSGDIKLEANTEYRFKMFKLFSGVININGAVFADAGNIWLSHQDDKLPGAEFHFNTLYQDIALSSGAGLRFDLGGFLVIRLDWAIPLKKPYILENNGWVLNKIQFDDKEWRQQNINLNLAIGYPF